MSFNKVMFSKKTDDWRTPSDIYDYFISRGYYDPCPFHSSRDGLIGDWARYNFVNPPYSDLMRWVRKCIEQRDSNHAVIMLVPARTDTKWFKLLYDYGCLFTFITGRLRFNDADNAPFPSMFVDLFGYGQSSMVLVSRDFLMQKYR